MAPTRAESSSRISGQLSGLASLAAVDLGGGFTMGRIIRLPCITSSDTYGALERWARRKYKALFGRRQRSAEWLHKVKDAFPQFFHHWRVIGSDVG